MEINFKRQMNQSFMTIRDSFAGREICELQMLANNGIPALLSMEIEVSDGEICYWYDITGYQSLADYLGRRQLNMELLTLLLSGLEELYGQLGEYLLAEAPLFLRPEYIYLDFAGKRLAFTYVPGWEEEPAEAFQGLMEHLLQQLDHKDRKAVETAYDMYQMSLQRELPLEDMLKQVRRREESAQEALDVSPEPESKEEPNFRSDKRKEGLMGAFGRERMGTPEQGGFLEKLSRFHRKESIWGRGEQADEPIYMTGQEEPAAHPTELLYEEGKLQGKLCYQGQKGWQDLILGKGDFLIGKKRQEVDGFLPERTVSRIHARIERDGEAYFLEDLNSTNGTFLNGERLEYRQKAKLSAGDIILFGNVEYRFI